MRAQPLARAKHAAVHTCTQSLLAAGTEFPWKLSVQRVMQPGVAARHASIGVCGSTPRSPKNLRAFALPPTCACLGHCPHPIRAKRHAEANQGFPGGMAAGRGARTSMLQSCGSLQVSMFVERTKLRVTRDVKGGSAVAVETHTAYFLLLGPQRKEEDPRLRQSSCNPSQAA